MTRLSGAPAEDSPRGEGPGLPPGFQEDSSDDPPGYEAPGGGVAGNFWHDPNGIIALADPADNFVRVGHRVIVVCDSHRSLMARMTGYRPTSGSSRKRVNCPGCGRMADLIMVDGEGVER